MNFPTVLLLTSVSMAFLISVVGWWPIVVIVMVFNIKSLPFLYHLKTSRIILKRFFVSKPRSLFMKTVYTSRLWFDDLDMNIHMNNSSYNKHIDYARLEFLLNYSKDDNFNLKYKVANAGVQVFFKREIKPFTLFSIETTLLSWDEKWFFLEHRFMSSEGLHAIAISKLVYKAKNGKTLKFPDAIEMNGFSNQVDLNRKEKGLKVVKAWMESESEALSLLM